MKKESRHFTLQREALKSSNRIHIPKGLVGKKPTTGDHVMEIRRRGRTKKGQSHHNNENRER